MIASVLESNNEVLATWINNPEIIQFFQTHADRFTCEDDTVSLLVTREMVDTLIEEIDDFLYGMVVEESERWFSPLEGTDVRLVYKESLV